MAGRGRESRNELDEVLARQAAGASPGFLLWHATLRWQRGATAALADMGLTHVQFLVLASCRWLSRTSKVPSQRDIAAHAGLDQVMTSQVVRTLERDGLLERTRDDDDRRIVRVRVTAAGRSLAARSVVTMDAVDADFFAPAAPLETLLEQLRILGGRDWSGEAARGS